MLRFVQGKTRGNHFFTDTMINPYLGVYGAGDQIFVFEQYMNHKHFKGDRAPTRAPFKDVFYNSKPSFVRSNDFTNGDYILKNTVPLYYASLYAKQIVISYMAREIGLFTPVIMDENRPFKSYGALRSSGGKPIALLFHPYSLNVKEGNYFDIYLNLIHEKNHFDTLHDAHHKNASEYDAYDEVFHHPYFKYASHGYQEHVIFSLNFHRKALRKTGHLF